ncbi:excalibur calcium-binding domain-containing protein [Microvirga sp. VF16]|uniref:excalibur calcium-binding domain-containing protein n=1 Tax=Microvirga sp. VF16 TaxID=2807101 RepID=UPI00193D6848|nr:excalibur calcium-binding domain-containing protein [Microvirga sp. VF16]QRM28340.1 excalibur calcium-binding domain-containing protein [Microvirga sp. VF16]
MRGLPERSSRYSRRDPQIEAQKLKRRFQAVSDRSFRTRGPRKFKRRSWDRIIVVARLAAAAIYIFYTWAWKSNLWLSEQVRLQAAYITDCASARRLGIAPLYRGFPGYRASLDRDGDGIACEPYPF